MSSREVSRQQVTHGGLKLLVQRILQGPRAVLIEGGAWPRELDDEVDHLATGYDCSSHVIPAPRSIIGVPARWDVAGIRRGLVLIHRIGNTPDEVDLLGVRVVDDEPLQP